MKLIASAALAAAMSFVALGASADTLKVAFIDPLSGPMGPSGESGLKHFMFAAEELNAGARAARDDVDEVPGDADDQVEEEAAAEVPRGDHAEIGDELVVVRALAESSTSLGSPLTPRHSSR